MAQNVSKPHALRTLHLLQTLHIILAHDCKKVQDASIFSVILRHFAVAGYIMPGWCFMKVSWVLLYSTVTDTTAILVIKTVVLQSGKYVRKVHLMLVVLHMFPVAYASYSEYHLLCTLMHKFTQEEAIYLIF